MLILLALFVSGNHWTKVKDANRVHEDYVTGYGSPLGWYYEPATPRGAPFTAECWLDASKPVVFATEDQARAYVVGCPQ